VEKNDFCWVERGKTNDVEISYGTEVIVFAQVCSDCAADCSAVHKQYNKVQEQ
jgi:hypothetical protein